MTAEELAQRSADDILRSLDRDEKTLNDMLHNKPRGGWRWTDEELRKELLLAGVVRELKGPEKQTDDPRVMTPECLKKKIDRMMDRLFLMRRELSRKTGDVPQGRNDINFEEYVTE